MQNEKEIAEQPLAKKGRLENTEEYFIFLKKSNELKILSQIQLNIKNKFKIDIKIKQIIEKRPENKFKHIHTDIVPLSELPKN
ncbi:hypothetical protein BpHYR1_033754 [Brachionus plicatilis]|uniref:Uncharacterized protein n=1 Tax=Brachionus plicatilis TaxID=10195 RepID=A0A3M7T268_BRAPC|nr:hypothetical protein BpHYR1_033754 [Brachionus plicatilis]